MWCLRQTYLGELDQEILSSVQSNIMSKLNCTIPFVPPRTRNNSKICVEKTAGKTGIDLYYNSPLEALNLWTWSPSLAPPCQFYRFDMKETYSFTGKKHRVWRWYEGNLKYDDSNTEELWLEFVSEMNVDEQFWTYTFMSYIAENGGFVGLFLGYSVLSFSDFISSFLDNFKQCKKAMK